MISGSGVYTVVDGEKIAMDAGDLVLTLNWKWHDHAAHDQEVVLFSYSDLPMLEPFGFLREESFSANGDYQTVL